MKILVKIFLPVFFVISLSAQQKNNDLLGNFLEEKNKRTIVVPSVYYLPETNWYFGLAGFSYFKFNKNKEGGNDTITRPSQIRMALGYTLNKQIVFWLPAEVFFKENKYRLLAELGFYRWPYFFNGIGNNIETSYEENYRASFPRARLAFQKRLGKSIYLGPKYWFQYLKMNEVEPGGKFENGLVPGGNGGVNSGFGVSFLYDTRNSVFASTQGWYAEYSNLFNQTVFGSDFVFNTHILDVRKYVNIKANHIVALQAYGKFNFGDVPFNQMSLMGGPFRMRGYREGRFRDKHIALMQLEYRSPLVYRTGLTVFGAYGIVGNKPQNLIFKNGKTSIGGGLRFSLDEKDRMHIRFDYAWGEGKENRFGYFTIGESF